MEKTADFYITAANVFANLAFLTPSKTCENKTNDFLNFKINFKGEKNGTMLMKIEKRLLEYINSIMTDGQDDIKECGKELINIICGNVLADVFTDKKRFKLEPPEFVEKFEINDACCKTEIFFDEGCVYLSCKVEEI